MATPKKHHRLKEAIIQLRMLPEVKEAIIAQAAKRGLSLTAFMTMLALAELDRTAALTSPAPTPAAPPVRRRRS